MPLQQGHYFLYSTSQGRSEFLVSVNKYVEARSQKLSVGMRFKMRFEGEEGDTALGMAVGCSEFSFLKILI